MRVLVIEDQLRFAQLLKDCLEQGGFVVDTVDSVAGFNAQAPAQDYDLFIVDLGLPDGDGLQAIRSYRDAGGTKPVIVVTARNMVNDLVNGLDCGADDFLTKPFHIEALKARIRAVLRRPQAIQKKEHCVGRLKLDQETGEIHFEDGNVALSPAERRLLAVLMRRAGSVVSKSLIDGQVNGSDRCCTPNAVEQLVSRLRKSLARAEVGVDVKTVRGIGYVLEERTH
ncbi:MAG: response regulator transcription factor [Hyphomicrobiaceae bacterium]|nr:response regulator transcription factor [Hyphomicrobiaceae bacterium]